MVTEFYAMSLKYCSDTLHWSSVSDDIALLLELSRYREIDENIKVFIANRRDQHLKYTHTRLDVCLEDPAEGFLKRSTD